MEYHTTTNKVLRFLTTLTIKDRHINKLTLLCDDRLKTFRECNNHQTVSFPPQTIFIKIEKQNTISSQYPIST